MLSWDNLLGGVITSVWTSSSLVSLDLYSKRECALLGWTVEFPQNEYTFGDSDWELELLYVPDTCHSRV